MAHWFKFKICTKSKKNPKYKPFALLNCPSLLSPFHWGISLTFTHPEYHYLLVRFAFQTFHFFWNKTCICGTQMTNISNDDMLDTQNCLPVWCKSFQNDSSWINEPKQSRWNCSNLVQMWSGLQTYRQTGEDCCSVLKWERVGSMGEHR